MEVEVVMCGRMKVMCGRVRVMCRREGDVWREGERDVWRGRVMCDEGDVWRVRVMCRREGDVWRWRVICGRVRVMCARMRVMCVLVNMCFCVFR